MDTSEILYKSVLNIALLVLMANLMLKSKIVRDSLLQEKRSLKSQVLLSAVFGGLVILSTCTAMDTGYYNINTRVIGAMAAGLLGGPVVGLYASLIGAVYAYVFSSPQVFAMAAAFSTMMFGLLGGGFYPYFQRGKWKYMDLFLLACFAEVCDMVCLLRFAAPVQMALNSIFEISVPMILINSVGILIFILIRSLCSRISKAAASFRGRLSLQEDAFLSFMRESAAGKTCRGFQKRCFQRQTGQAS